MSGESYTRWHSTPSDEDDDDDDGGGGASGGGGGGGDGSSVTIITPSQRPAPAPTLASPAAQARVICVMILVCLVCVVIGMWVGWSWAHHHKGPHFPVNLVVPAHPPDHTLVHRLLYSLSPALINDYMRELSETPEEKLAIYIESVWQGQGLDTSTTSFTVDIATQDTQRPSSVTVMYNSGEKEVLPLPPVPTIAAAASSGGGVSGVVVYGHYGQREDLTTLQSLKISLQGAILLLRHGRIHPGAKLHNAQQAGAAGVIFYPDPDDFRGAEGGGDAFPEGMGLPDDGVLWQSVKTVPGDPATPCIPSLDNVFRTNDTERQERKVPGLSVSMEVAEHLLGMMSGPDVPEKWAGGLAVSYQLGGAWRPATNITNITLTVNTVTTTQTITNIHATLPAADETKAVMIGSHYGEGHVSPRSGLASLLALSDALAKSYLPKGTGRKMVFSAWAATQQGMIGSTEFSQLHSWWVEGSVLAYLSLDEVVRGTGSLRVLASPLLRQAIREAANQVPWAEGGNISVREGWKLSDSPGENDVHFSNLGSGGDYVSFVAQRGVPSAHFMVVGKDGAHTYSLRHSQYDSYKAYTALLDPNLAWTHMLTSLVGGVAVVLSESEVPPVLLSEVSGDLYNAWRSFTDTHSRALSQAPYNFTSILDAISREILTLQDRLSLLDDWYQKRPYYLRPLQSQPQRQQQHSEMERRLWWVRNLERGLLGPRGVARDFTNNVMLGPDPQDPYTPLHFPHVTRAITRALNHLTPWHQVHLELSYVLAALASYRQLFDSDFPAEPAYTS